MVCLEVRSQLLGGHPQSIGYLLEVTVSCFTFCQHLVDKIYRLLSFSLFYTSVALIAIVEVAKYKNTSSLIIG